jgi:hypothetical protein
MIDWPEYVSHKVVRAARVIDVIGGPGGHSVLVDPGNGGLVEVFTPTHAGMLDNVRVGDWAMLYPDGYRSISPAKAFDEGYTIVTKET